MKATSALSLAIAAGIASTAAANNTPTELAPSSQAIKHAGHIYFNVATGEKITTLIEAGDAQRPVAGEPGSEIWIADTGGQCLDTGYSTSYFFGLDNPNDPTTSLNLTTGAIMFDWGDIASDTVVDCVQIHWITNHPDTDTDSDSIADGVEGFMGTWTYWDGMNGRSPQLDCTAIGLVGFGFFSLNGEFPADTATVALWTADIDLGATFGTSLTFEIADSDGDLQGAAVASDIRFPAELDADSDSIPDWDHDQDGLADWGWSLQYVQPGTSDVDNADGDSDTQTGIDGVAADGATAGVVFGSPTPGHPEFDSIGGGWNWVSDGPTAGATEDAFTLGTTADVNGGDITIAGTFWFGGLDCTAGSTTGYSPASHFQTVLYGPGGGCVADLSGPTPGLPDGVLDFFDISFYLGLFGAGDLSADLSGPTPGTPDGGLDFFDISYYLGLFGAGCP